MTGQAGIGGAVAGANPYAAGFQAAATAAAGGPSTATQGDTLSESGTGSKVFNFGANPNLGLVGTGAFSSPLLTIAMLGGVGAVAFLAGRKRKR